MINIATLPDTNNIRASSNKGLMEKYDSPVYHWKNNGINTILFPLSNFPLNPFVKMHGLYSGLDIYRAFKLLFQQKRYQACICYFESPAFFLCLFKKLHLLKNMKIIVNEINYNTGWRKRDFVVNFVLNNCDAVGVVTEHLKQKIQISVKRDDLLIYKTGFHVDAKKFIRTSAPNKGYFFSIGDDRSRDYSTLIAASKMTSANIIIKTSKNIEIPSGVKTIKVINENLSSEELIKMYQEALAVIIPLSYIETAGGVTTLVEAMAMGKCIVIADTPALSEYLTPENCISYKVGNSIDLAEKINNLIRCPNIIQSFEKASFDFYLNNFTRESYFSNYSKFIKNLCLKY